MFFSQLFLLHMQDSRIDIRQNTHLYKPELLFRRQIKTAEYQEVVLVAVRSSANALFT